MQFTKGKNMSSICPGESQPRILGKFGTPSRLFIDNNSLGLKNNRHLAVNTLQDETLPK
jgi:hypothetical protein